MAEFIGTLYLHCVLWDGLCVYVAPAKREGKSTSIFDRSLGPEHISSGQDGEVCISICAAGMYDSKSEYRYTMSCRVRS